MDSTRRQTTLRWSRVALRTALLLGWVGSASAQDAPASNPPPPSSPSPFQKPSGPPGSTRETAEATANRSKPGSPAEISMDERLKRMEEAYLRMERNNQRIQSQYDKLLQKYDDLSRKVSQGTPAQETASPIARTASLSGSTTVNANRTAGTPGRRLADLLGVEEGDADEPVGLAPLLPDPSPAQDATGAQGTGGRTGINQQGAPGPMVSPGDIGRGGGSPDGNQAAPFMSRMDQIGAGAEGTGGRTSITQQRVLGGSRARGELGTFRLGGEGEEVPSGAPGVDLLPKRHPGKIAFGQGLEFTSDDGEFRLQFHNLTQVEFRGFDRHDLGTLEDQFFIPRQRWYFVGDLTKNVGFYTVINRGYGSLDLLDAFISLRYSTAFRMRIGRMKTPYLYEYFSIAEGDQVAPERSIFASNLALNRQIGVMFLGEVFKGQLSYATGVFNGPRRSFQNLNNAVDMMGIITWRPFLLSERFKALNYFNIGGSWDVGYQDNNPPQPVYFETANDQTPNNATSLSPTFLHLNNNVIELGERVQWGGHAVWNYKSFFLLGEYGGVRSGYGIVNNPSSVPVNMSGWNVTASYFLTGEQVTRRVNMVQPLRDFNFDFLKPGGKFSPGAVEVFARYSTLDIGRNIFTGGFADPNLWTNHVYATDIGVNWYLNFYTRIYLDWQHDGFGNEVSVAPNKFSSTADIYWLRFQVFF
jgi:phosphate-selective porin OprO/OprP